MILNILFYLILIRNFHLLHFRRKCNICIYTKKIFLYFLNFIKTKNISKIPKIILKPKKSVFHFSFLKWTFLTNETPDKKAIPLLDKIWCLIFQFYDVYLFCLIQILHFLRKCNKWKFWINFMEKLLIYDFLFFCIMQILHFLRKCNKWKFKINIK